MSFSGWRWSTDEAALPLPSASDVAKMAAMTIVARIVCMFMISSLHAHSMPVEGGTPSALHPISAWLGRNTAFHADQRAYPCFPGAEVPEIRPSPDGHAPRRGPRVTVDS